MKQIILLLTVLFIGTSFSPNVQQRVFDIHFEKGESEFSEKGLKQLEQFFEQIETLNATYQVGLEIHPIDNETLNRERADVISDYLSEEGISVDKILFYSQKEDVPQDIQALENWNFVRLRLEITQKEVQDITPEVTAASASKQFIHSKNKEEEGLEIPKWAQPVVNYQGNLKEFFIDNNTSSKLRLGKSGFIEIAENSFVYEDGTPVEEAIRFITKLVDNKNVAILDELTTTFNGKLLESRGMVYVNAETKSGKTIQLAPNKSIDINLKTEVFEDNFQAFNANIDRMTGTSNWLLTENPKVDKKPIDRSITTYKYVKMSSDQQQEVKAKRDEYIQSWKEAGVSTKNIKHRLKRYKRYVKRKRSRIKDKRKILRRRGDKKPPKMRKPDYLGRTKHYYKFKKRLFKVDRYYAMSSYGFGWCNIDRLFNEENKKPPCDLMVKAPANSNVKISFNKYFIILKGFPTDDGFLFKGIPSGLGITIIGAEKLDNGNTINSSFKRAVTGNDIVVLDNFETTSPEVFTSRVKRYGL